MDELTHFNADGEAHMVDVSAKETSARVAVASGRVRMQPATLDRLRGGALKKGDVLATARLAGLMGLKETSALIPLCHPLPVDGAEVDLRVAENAVEIRATVRCTARTGVEMEALTAVSVAALTVYDMAKSIDKTMVIESIQLEEKSGGRSGHYHRGES